MGRGGPVHVDVRRPSVTLATILSATAGVLAAAQPGCVLAFGDSLTAGGLGSVPYTEQLSWLLRAPVETAGVWGETTAPMRSRLAVRLGRNKTLSLRPPSCRPWLLLLLGGTNDLADVPADETLANLCAMHDMAAEHGAIVGVLEIPVATHENLQGLPLMRREFVNAELWRRQAQYPYPSFMVNLSVVSARHLYDGIHFTTEGYAVFASAVFEALRHFLLARGP
mmetsp:Transcript_98167/g.311380  ORF Transcript_98167/g.311380 Transcript_98167/m.311380 type:complete len:224 (-) Transcript_98167:54-725(-)